ncbi:MAG: alpha/beta hydrolase [Pseudomonadota bacterium]
MTWTTRLRSEGAGGLAVWREGRGAPLVLIHGVGLRAEAWAGMMPKLSARFDVHAVDMPGHGASVRRGERGLEAFVDRFAAYLSALNTPIFLAGHSMGAMIALKLGARMPQSVAGVAALNGIHRRSAEAAEAVKARAALLDGKTIADPVVPLERWFRTHPEGPSASAAEACRTWLTECDPAGYAVAYEAFANADGPSDQTLANLTCPCLFLTGTKDLNSTPAMSLEMAARTSQGRAEIFETAAHMLPMTHAEDAADIILNTFKVAHDA